MTDQTSARSAERLLAFQGWTMEKAAQERLADEAESSESR
ncbi:hypothetical protein O9992_01320 [Vibrio lentus]|nr:hypothetical protein [Vibrio lentus]